MQETLYFCWQCFSCWEKMQQIKKKKPKPKKRRLERNSRSCSVQGPNYFYSNRAKPEIESHSQSFLGTTMHMSPGKTLKETCFSVLKTKKETLAELPPSAWIPYHTEHRLQSRERSKQKPKRLQHASESSDVTTRTY